MASVIETIKTPFGVIYRDGIRASWTCRQILDHADGGKFKFWDSNENYLDYWEGETIIETAAASDMSPKKWWDTYKSLMENAKTIEEIVGSFTNDYLIINKKDEDAQKQLINAIITQEEQWEKDYYMCSIEEICEEFTEILNIIGDYIIVRYDCY